jgi:GWxTD domain-containing protein
MLCVALAACVAVSCSGTKHADIERASEYNYTQYRAEDGHPEVRLTASAFLNEEDEGIISVTGDIENRSLIFRHIDGETTADVEIVITVVGREGKRYLDSYSTTKTIENEIYGHIIISNVTRFEKEMKVPPGSYAIFFAVKDKASDSETIREVYATVPDPGEVVVNLTPVQLYGNTADEPGKGFEPVTTYDISTKKDSIRFRVQVMNNNTDKPIVLRSRLVRFEADTSAARSASHPNYSVSSLPYRGIDYRNEEDMDQTQRILDQPGIVMIEYNFERPERGNYRFEVTTDGVADGEELFRARDFSVKGENFPRIESPREFAEPLVYLMNKDDYEKMMSIEDPDELKEAVDRFWLENIGSLNRAQRVIARYYERVEEANRQFTSFKEGWKTDRGMVYILFGPPVRIEQWLNGQQWLGSYETRDSRYNFIFHRSRIRSDYFPFDNYMLRRHQGYHTYQYQQVQLWRTGQILDVAM